MRFRILLLLLFTSFYNPSKATNTYVHFEFNLNRVVNVGEDSALKFVIKFHGTPTLENDSFILNKTLLFSKNYEFPTEWTLHRMVILIYNLKNTLLGTYQPVADFNTNKCDGFVIPNPFSNQTCIDLSSQKGGMICGNMNYHAVRDNLFDYPTYHDGHWSDRYGVYCKFESIQEEAPLYFKSPCSFNYKTNPKQIKWYESKNGLNDWVLVDSGIKMYPIKASYHGGSFYGHKRWYKAVVDTNWAKGVMGPYSSSVVGPIRFYVGKTIDSVKVNYPTKCNEKTNLTVHFQPDSLTQALKVPAIWIFYKAHDTLPEQRWFLGVINQPATNLAGRKIIPEPGYPKPPDSVVLNKGIYRIRQDFVPWNGFNCKLESTTVTIDTSLIYSFNSELVLLNSNACFGDKNAQIQVNLNTNDTGNFMVSNGSTMLDKPPYNFKNLPSGNFTARVTNSLGCSEQKSFHIPEAARFNPKLNIDTVLCTGQTVQIQAYDSLSKSYLWLNEKNDTLSHLDTITLNKSGKFYIQWKNIHGCISTDTVKILQRDLPVLHNFLLPSEGVISDTVYAVNISDPKPDSCYWKYSSQGVKTFVKAKFTLGATYPDTGWYILEVRSHFKGCGFSLSKPIHIVGNSDSSGSKLKLGYKGPLIESFTVDPNPSDGLNFKLKIKLRDTFNVSIYKIDPISGDIIGDIDLYKKNYYESTAFTSGSAQSGVFYLKLVAGNESKTIKVVISK